ncbi:MAG: TlpA family protein disulfide reductase [Myxococcales bacterium]|nr:TlpA family protein disulfide reductase [Myxococcales bacterium]
MPPKKAQPLPFAEPQRESRRATRHYRDEEQPPTAQGRRRDPGSSMINFLILAVFALLAYRMFNQPKPKIPAGSTAPRFTLIRMQDTQKWKPVLKNKTTVLHFWATWCPSCVRTLAQSSKRAKILQERGIQYLLVSTDLQMVTDDLKAFLKKQNIPTQEWGSYHVGPYAASQFKVRVLPSTVVIGPDAKIAHYAPGGLSDRALRSILQKVKRKAAQVASREATRPRESATPPRSAQQATKQTTPASAKQATKQAPPASAKAPAVPTHQPAKRLASPTSQPTSRSLHPTSQPR